MAHSVGEQAARAVKNSERKQAVEKRTPDEIIKGIRGNLAAHLSVTPSDIALLLMNYDALVGGVALLQMQLTEAEAKIADQQEKLDRFREVYEQENRSATVTLGENMQLIPVEGGLQVVPKE